MVKGLLVSIVFTLLLSQQVVAQPLPLEQIRQIKTIVEKYGFAFVFPPKSEFTPGSIVAIVSKNPLKVKTLCNSSVEPKQLTTLAFRKLENQNSKIFGDLIAGINNIIEAEISGEHGKVKKIDISLAEVSIYETKEETLYEEGEPNYSNCAKAVKDALCAGYPVTVIYSTFQAKIRYDVEITNESRLDVKIDIIKLLSNLFGIQSKVSVEDGTLTSSSLEVESLYWGVLEEDISLNRLLRDMLLYVRNEEGEYIPPTKSSYVFRYFL